MKELKKDIRNEVKQTIIATNGNVLNKHINAICDKYEERAKSNGISPYELTHIVVNESHYFAFSKQQAKFRETYKYRV